MNPQAYLPFYIAIIAGFIASLVSLLSWRYRKNKGGSYFILLMAAIAVYTLCSAFEVSSLSVADKLTWSKLSYMGVVSLSPLWFLFSTSYSQRDTWLTPSRVMALWVIPFLTLILAMTNEYHRLVWSSMTPVSSEPGARVIYGHGVVFWVHAAYAYLLMLVGTIWFIGAARRSTRLQRTQVVILIVAALCPWLGNIVYIFKIEPWNGLDLTPLAFLFTGLAIMLNIFRYQMLNLAPIARDVIFDNILDGVIVIDSGNRIIDVNPTARRWLGTAANLIGQNIFDVMNKKAQEEKYKDIQDLQTEFEATVGGERQVFDLTISPLLDDRSILLGRVVLFHDISHERSILDNEHERTRQIGLLNEITRLALETANLDEMIRLIGDKLNTLFGADRSIIFLKDSQNGQPVTTVVAGKSDNQIDLSFLPGLHEVLKKREGVLFVDANNPPDLIDKDTKLCLPLPSIMAFPLVSNNTQSGLGVIGFDHPHSFNSDEIDLCKQASWQLSLGIAKAQSYHWALNRADQLMALQSVSQVITSSLDLSHIFMTVAQVLHDTFGYRYVSIYRLDKETLYLGTQVGYPDELVMWKIPIAKGIIGRSVRTRQPQFVADVSADPDFLRASYEVNQEICVPLIKSENILGILNIESDSHQLLTENDLNLLLAFANQVVVAIDHASLFQSEHDSRKMAEALLEVGFALGKSLDLNTVLDRLLVSIKEVIPFDTANFLLVDDNTQRARAIRWSGYERLGISDPQIVPFELEIATTTNLRYMTDTGKPLIIPDVKAYPGWIIIDQFKMIRSYAGAPILINGKVAAFLSFEKIEPDFYGPEIINPMAAFANQAAIALQNAHLYNEVQRLATIDELTGLYNRRGLFEIGKHELERAIRLNRTLAILFIDVDHFKSVNDTYSYAVGDLTLSQIADCIRSNLREIDLIGRYGGEEFVVILPEIDEHAIQLIAERLRLKVEQLEVKAEQAIIHVTISIGVSQKPEHPCELGSLVDRAGQALHIAKKRGRNCVVVFEN